MPQDRILDVCDSAVSAISTAWTGQSGNDSVSREYLEEEALDTISGRLVRVFPLADEEVERLDRAEILMEYRIAAVVIERYTDPGLPTKEWMDERLLFVKQKVYDALNLEPPNTLVTGSQVFAWTIARPVVYDLTELGLRNLFWSEVEVAYREVVAG